MNSEYVRSAFEELLLARLLTRNAAAMSASTIHGTHRSDGDAARPLLTRPRTLRAARRPSRRPDADHPAETGAGHWARVRGLRDRRQGRDRLDDGSLW